MTKTATTQHAEIASPAIRILKIATCPSASGKSELTYHVGCTPESEILIRVYGNSASGYFNRDWIGLTTIQKLFQGAKGEPVTSFVLHSQFIGKSTNTPAFLFAAILNEGLVQPSTKKKRCYDCTDGKRFFAEVKSLIASKVDLADKVQKLESKKAEKAAANAQLAEVKPRRTAKGQSVQSAGLMAKPVKAGKKPITKPVSK